MLRRLTPLLGLAVLLAPGPAARAEWRPANGPLMTRWAKDVKPDNVHPEYPRPQLRRERWLNLNGVWQLAVAKKDEPPPFGKELPERILVPFPVESALSGVMKPAERLWYRRTFTVPAGWARQRVLIHFGAVDWEATVYVNGKKVGTHQGGYDPFTFDVTDFLRPGGPQEIIVGVYDPTDGGTQPRGKQVLRPGGIYYTPTTGIWQTVWLEPVPAVRIERLKIVPAIDGKTGIIRLSADCPGAGPDHRLLVTIRDGGRSWGGKAKGVKGAATVRIPDARLWSPSSPHLYDLTVTLLHKGKVIDKVESYVGIRTIALGKSDGKGPPAILLNGKPLFQVGVLDQGFWPDGLYTAPTDAALRYDVEMTKKLGFNLSRKHVKVEPARWYYWCDKLGLLVWQDMPSGDRSINPKQPDIKRTPESAAQFELELRRMMDGLHNHPCIVSWVIFNEGWGQYDTARITAWAKKHDPTRIINQASGWADRKGGDVHDVHDYPGPSAPPPEPGRAAVLGEFGGLGLAIEGHVWTKKTWGYLGARDKADLTRKYERLLQGCWRLHRERGLSAVVYTQLTDVESEANGLLTYDREVIKVDLARVAAVNGGDFSQLPTWTVVVPTSERVGLSWRYTLKKPGKGWYRADFDDSGWKEGPGGFGTKGTPGAVVRTEWKTNNIWIRRPFDLPKGPTEGLHLRLHHDEDAEVYLNGVRAARVKGFVTDYVEVPIAEEALRALRPGCNTIAIHCRQTVGGQYIDAGLVRLRPAKR
jgi:hypothetical protein